MADGSIVIETGLDNTGLEQGIKAMEQAMQKAATEMQNQLRNLGNDSKSSIDTAAQSVSNLQNAIQNAGATAGQQLSSNLEQAAQNTSQNIDTISDSLQDMAEQAGQAGEELSQNIGDSLGDVGDTINENVREPLEQLGDTLGGLDDSLGGLGDGLGGLDDSLGGLGDGLTEPLEDLPEPLDDVESGLIHIRDGIEDIERISPQAFGRTVGDIDNMDRELQEAEKSAERVRETFSKLGSHVADAMKKAGAAATAAFGVAVGAAVKVGTDFESGMSQVAATMGITVDEIAAGSQEFESLSQAAKNAGATTQFSATQASEALNYLALAGYDAEKSITALPTVLNLAAAGGIDLGYASDMVTDSMSALGLSTNQLEGFVDQLAKTSQKSNTNIAQLGEGILTVGGTAKDLAGGTVELNTALGILADNGIKGAEGGTALRNMILSLSAPTDTARKAMKELGLEAFDSNGKLSPLNETFQDLNSKLGEMSDEDRINVLNTMFNKVDLKSVNALLANSGERFDELSGYIRDSAGAAEEMAETMNDNLKGKLTILGSALEGLGIEMYEEFQQPLKEAAETAIKSVDSISASLKNGKLSESMQTVARGIGTIVSKAAELAISTLPKLINGFAFLVDNAKLLGTVLASTAGAVATFKGAMLINDIVKSWNAAERAARMFGAGMTSSLTGTQAAVGVATSKLGIMQAATAALGGPMGVAALAVAGVTAGIVALTIATRDDNSELSRNKKAIEELSESLEESEKAWEAIEERRQESINTSFAEIDNTERQIDALKELVDENGKVKDGYEDKAKALADQINSVIPEAISLAEDESGAYVKVADSIDLMIAKKKINALIDANQESYTNALKENKDIVEKYADALEEQRIAEENLAKINADLTLNEWEYSEAVREAEENLNNANQAVKNLGKQYEENISTITEQNNLLTTSQSESVEEINNAIASQGVALQQYTATQSEEADKQLQNEKDKLAALEIMHQQFNNEYTQSELEAQQKRVDEAQAIADNAHAEAEAALVELVKKMIENTTSKQGELLSAGEFLMQGLADGIKNKEQAVLATAASVATSIMNSFTGVKGFIIASPSKWAFGVGNFLMQGLANGISKNSTIAIGATNAMVQNLKNTVQGSDGNALTDYFNDIGESFPKNIKEGIEKNKSSVIESVEELAESSLTTAMEQAEEYKDIGNLFGENYLAGLEEKLEATTELIEKNTDKSIKAYEEFIDEQTESVIQRREEQTNAEVEKLQEQISKLKDVKDKGQKEANKAEIKEIEKRIKILKDSSKKDIARIKEESKEKKDAYKKGMQEIEKAGLDVIKKATSDIEKEYESRKDSIVEKYQSQKDTILSIQDNLYSKTSEYGELFHYDDETGEMLLNDLTENTKAVNQYYDSLEKLSNIDGISDSFVKMIATEYDVEEGTKIINELLKMGDTRLQAYASEWDKLQEMSSQRSNQFLDNELSVIDASFNQEINRLKNDLPEMTRQALADSVNEIATVFPEKYAELIQLDPEFFNNMLNTLNTEILGNLSEQEGIVVPIKAEAENFPEKVTEQIPGIQEAGSEATVALGEQIGKDGKKVVTEADDVGEDTVRALESHEPEFQQIGEEYMDRLIDGMQSKWGTAVGVAHEIAESLKDELEDVASFSMRDTEDAMSARSLMESVEPAMISRLYDSMVDSIGFYQSRLAAASTSYITNNSSSRVENNMGDVNFNIAEVKGENVDRSVNNLMEQAEFYRRQKRLAVGVK